MFFQVALPLAIAACTVVYRLLPQSLRDRLWLVSIYVRAKIAVAIEDDRDTDCPRDAEFVSACMQNGKLGALVDVTAEFLDAFTDCDGNVTVNAPFDEVTEVLGADELCDGATNEAGATTLYVEYAVGDSVFVVPFTAQCNAVEFPLQSAGSSTLRIPRFQRAELALRDETAIERVLDTTDVCNAFAGPASDFHASDDLRVNPVHMASWAAHKAGVVVLGTDEVLMRLTSFRGGTVAVPLTESKKLQ